MAVEFYVWKREGVDEGFVNTALDAINNDFDPQVDFDVDAYSMTHYPSVPDRYTGWEDIFNYDFVPWIEEYYGCPSDRSCHMVVVDNSNTGAGATSAPMNYGGGRFDCSTDGTVAGVNGFVKALENTDGCYGGNGKAAFKATVLHNVIHALVHPNQSHPSDDCDDNQADDHSLGKIDSNGDVTPAQMWYTGDPCSGNSPPCNNCDGEPNEYASGIRFDLSYCERTRVERFYDNYL